jgi:hypothetical protein
MLIVIGSEFATVPGAWQRLEPGDTDKHTHTQQTQTQTNTHVPSKKAERAGELHQPAPAQIQRSGYRMQRKHAAALRSHTLRRAPVMLATRFVTAANWFAIPTPGLPPAARPLSVLSLLPRSRGESLRAVGRGVGARTGSCMPQRRLAPGTPAHPPRAHQLPPLPPVSVSG